MAVVCFPGLEKPKYEPNPHYHENAVMQKTPSAEDSCVSSASEMGACSQNSAAKPVIKKMLNRKHCLAVTDSSAAQEESEPCYRRNAYSVKCSMKKKIMLSMKMKNQVTENLRARTFVIEPKVRMASGMNASVLYIIQMP